ncbi:MAG: hypothetical protein QXX95_01895 [Nitrososphaerales archaeon]
MRFKAYSPTHITGIFEICDHYLNPLRRGSKGAGLCLEKGIYSTVELKDFRDVKIFINGKISEAPVSEKVIEYYRKIAGKEFGAYIYHDTEAPIGSGFGTSGGGALGLSLALNEALGLNLSYKQVTQIAHLAEIICKTGLGTVIAETKGGLEIRIKEGAPGYGEIISYPVKDYYLLALSLSKLSTKEALSNLYIRSKINGSCAPLLKELVEKPSLENFLKVSQEFSFKVNLMSEGIRKRMKDLSSYGYHSGMAMFGDTLFTLVKEGELKEVERILKDEALFISPIANKGAHLL